MIPCDLSSIWFIIYYMTVIAEHGNNNKKCQNSALRTRLCITGKVNVNLTC
jgi:hypothetical protein